MARIETGPIQFGDDWPGIFIRGDNAMYFSMELNAFLESIPVDSELNISPLLGLARVLASCDARGDQADVQKLKKAEDVLQP